MTQTKINGSTQIASNTVTSSQVDSSVLIAAGTNALTGNLAAGGNKITNLATPTSSTDSATKGYVDSALQGAHMPNVADAGTNTETLTIASGSVTQIGGTTVNGISVDVNDIVFIGNAPASTGAAGGSTLSTEPANGLYIVTANSTNISVSRASDFSSGSPAGAGTFVAGGSLWGGFAFVVTSPDIAGAAFTWGTTNIKFTQVGGLSQITSDGTLTIAGNEITRAALTGDVTAAIGSNATTIAAGAVSLAKIASGAYSSSPAASVLAQYDANDNLSANNVFENTTSVTSAGGTTTLTITSSQTIIVTGTTTQTIKLPTTSVPEGAGYTVINLSTGNVTVESSGANSILVLSGASSAPYQAALFVANAATPTTAANWTYLQYAAGTATGTVTSVSVATANGFEGTVATATSTPAITIETSLGSGVIASNGSGAIVLATGANIVAPSSGHGLSNQETPSGTVNGSNTSFSLANTPVSGTVMLFQNGLLLVAGSGKDYTISSGTITFITAPVSGDVLLATYWY